MAKRFMKIGRRVEAIQYFDLEMASRFGRHGITQVKERERTDQRFTLTVVFCAVVILLAIALEGAR